MRSAFVDAHRQIWVKPSFSGFNSSTFSLFQVEFEDLHQLSLSGTYVCVHSHTKHHRQYKECHTQVEVVLYFYQWMSAVHPNPWNNNITNNQKNIRLLGAEREEAASLSYPPPPHSPHACTHTLFFFFFNYLILSRMFLIPSSMTLVLLFQQFSTRLFHTLWYSSSFLFSF